MIQWSVCLQDVCICNIIVYTWNFRQPSSVRNWIHSRVDFSSKAWCFHQHWWQCQEDEEGVSSDEKLGYIGIANTRTCVCPWFNLEHVDGCTCSWYPYNLFVLYHPQNIPMISPKRSSGFTPNFAASKPKGGSALSLLGTGGHQGFSAIVTCQTWHGKLVELGDLMGINGIQWWFNGVFHGIQWGF